MNEKIIPIYLFTGFLESGKTKFIQETFEDESFDSGEKTLLLVCEEGEEEYNPEKFAFDGVTVEVISDVEEFTTENLQAAAEKSGAERIVLEYNGMWKLDVLTQNIPENWRVFQCISCADGATALTYAREKAMRGLFLDKISRSELMVFNRAEAIDNDEAKQELHEVVRQASRRCDIAYEFEDGRVEYDEIPDPLPFDLDAKEITIADEDFGVWFMDCSEEPQKYKGKIVNFLAQVYKSPNLGKKFFVPGRFAMTCCMDDIEFVGFPCAYESAKDYEDRQWVRVTAKVNVKFSPVYDGEGPVLTALDVIPAEKPADDVVRFS